LKKQARAILWWGVLSFGSQLAVIVLPLMLGYGLQGSMIGLVALGAGRLAWTALLVLRSGYPVWRSDLLQRYLRFAAPLMLNMAVGNLVLMFDNWLVGWWYHDQAVFAVFRYGSRELPLAQALASALGVAIIPGLAEHFTTGMSDLKAMSRRLFHLLFPVTILLLFISKPLFPLVFNRDFAASAPLFNIYLLLTASRVLLPNSIVLAKGAPRVILLVGIAELLVKIILGFVFIHCWGLPGLAWSAVIAFALEKALLMLYLRQNHGIQPGEWLDWKVYGLYLAALYAAYAISVIA
jgi:O-antigen/teichoic acid export membrane protein